MAAMLAIQPHGSGNVVNLKHTKPTMAAAGIVKAQATTISPILRPFSPLPEAAPPPITDAAAA